MTEIRVIHDLRKDHFDSQHDKLYISCNSKSRSIPILASFVCLRSTMKSRWPRGAFSFYLGKSILMRLGVMWYLWILVMSFSGFCGNMIGTISMMERKVPIRFSRKNKNNLVTHERAGGSKTSSNYFTCFRGVPQGKQWGRVYCDGDSCGQYGCARCSHGPQQDIDFEGMCWCVSPGPQNYLPSCVLCDVSNMVLTWCPGRLFLTSPTFKLL